MRLKRFENRQTIEFTDVVLADDNNGISPNHHFKGFFVKHHFRVRGEHLSLGCHLSDNSDNSRAVGQHLGEVSFPVVERLRGAPAVEPPGHESAAFDRRFQIDSGLRSKSVEIAFQHSVRGDQKTRLLGSQAIGEKRNSQPERTWVTAVEGRDVTWNGDPDATQIDWARGSL